MGKSYDVVVVGGGPGGYPGAIYAAKRGLRVALVEKEMLGGECTNYGCVPSKALVAVYESVGVLSRFGAQGVALNAALSFARSVAKEARDGIESLLTGLGVDIYRGYGIIRERGVEIDGLRLDARLGVLYAPGSRPRVPEGYIVDNRFVLDNRGFFEHGLPDHASEILVVGGGYVGVELSLILAGAGYNVTIAEATGSLLPGFDRDLSMLARRVLKRAGVRVWLNTIVESLRPVENGVEAFIGGAKTSYDAAIVAVGRTPWAPEAVRAGASLDEKGFVIVDSCGRATKPWLYVAGDAAGPPMLAHKAIHESITAVECMMGGEPLRGSVVPAVVYGPLDLVSVGATLEEAGKGALEVRIPTGGLAKQRIAGVRDGLVKIVVKDGRIAGYHAGFPGASESAAEAAVAVEKGLTVEDLATIIHPHPTMAEAVWEAVMEALGGSIHVLRGRVREYKEGA